MSFTPCSSVSIVTFKHVIADCGMAGHFFLTTYGFQMFNHFCTPWRHHKTRSVLMFSGDVEMELWPGMGLEKLLVIICKYILLIRKLQEILWFHIYKVLCFYDFIRQPFVPSRPLLIQFWSWKHSRTICEIWSQN